MYTEPRKVKKCITNREKLKMYKIIFLLKLLKLATLKSSLNIIKCLKPI